MKHVNAKEILPKELVHSIQKYIDGQPLYIPRKYENKKAWGQTSGAKAMLKKRNLEIYVKFQNDVKISELAKQYYLSEKSIRRIVSEVKKPNWRYDRQKEVTLSKVASFICSI